MSIRSLYRRHVSLVGPGALVVATCLAPEAQASATEFRPTMSFGLFHDGNIAVVGGAQGDEVAALSFDLIWDRKTPTSTLMFAYRPIAVFYHQSDDLDYFGNTLVVDFTDALSDDSEIRVDGWVERTERQGQTAATADRATTFVPRSTQSLATLKVDGSAPAGRRGTVDWQVRGGVDRYEESAPVDPSSGTPAQTEFNDGAWVGANAAWEGELSERHSLGLGLGGSYFGYELTPSVTVATFGLVGTSQTGLLWKIDYAVGASRAKSDTGADDGFSFDMTVEYEPGQSSTFQAGARQVYAPGTGLGGATQDLGAWLSYSHTRDSRGIFGSVIGGYWLRDSLENVSVTTSGDTETLNFHGSLGWEFNRFVALEAAYAFVDQNATNGADPSLDTTYSSYGLYLRWAIRGR